MLLLLLQLLLSMLLVEEHSFELAVNVYEQAMMILMVLQLLSTI